MRILFLHRAFPAQFRYLAGTLAADPRNQVVFLTETKSGELPGVVKVPYEPAAKNREGTHPYLKAMEGAVLSGQAAYRAASRLKTQGFVPDLIVGHSGWGATLFMSDLFPRTPFIGHFEWYYRAHGASFGYDPQFPVSADNEAEIRIKNAPLLIDLAACHAGVCPTKWQQSRFPSEFQSKLTVLHEGIDTDFFRPDAEGGQVLSASGLDLSTMDEVVTYVATGMEPLRGFPQFMEMLSLLQKRRPGLHAVIVGEDRVEYGSPPPDGKTYKQLMLERFPFDLSRIHFTGRLGVADYRRVLLASSAHVYLTYPFILSWSALEAMSCGCVVIGSDSEPVREVVAKGENGLLADFFAPVALADQVEAALEDNAKAASIRKQARQTILERFDVKKLLPLQLALLQETHQNMRG